jgi:hypothetical protein
VHEIDENPVSRKHAGRNRLARFQRAQENPDNGFGWESMLKNLFVGEARDVVLRPFRRVDATDVKGQIGHSKILPAIDGGIGAAANKLGI